MNELKTDWNKVVARLAKDCLEQSPHMTPDQVHDQVEFHMSAPSLDKQTSDDFQDQGTKLWYPSHATWAEFDSALKAQFPEYSRAGMRSHPIEFK